MRTICFAFCCVSSLAAQTVWFEPNQGQVAGQTEWIGRSKGAYLYITGDEVVYANQKNMHLRLAGARKHTHVEGLEPTGGISSYFTGRDEKTWFTGIPHYAKLKYKDVYRGIDMIYYGSGRNIEYDFVLKPGADPKQIQLAFSEPVHLDHGDLVVAGLRQHKPRVLQNGREIAGSYRIAGSNRVELALARYDHSRSVIIDPVLEFSTYIGGPGFDTGVQTIVDSTGAIYLTGFTQSPASPSLNPFQQTNIVNEAPFMMKFTSQAKQVIYFAVLGSNGWDESSGMAVDSSGSAVVIGHTISATFPLKNAFESNYDSEYGTGFVTKLSSDGRSLVYSTYYGGSREEFPWAVRLDSQGNAYTTGSTWSLDFPTLKALQTTLAGNFDWYVGKFSPSGTLVFSTYLGGSANDYSYGLALAPDGSVFVVGSSVSSDFPLKNPIQTEPGPRASAGFGTPAMARISGDGQTLLYSTFIGGPIFGWAGSVVLDSIGNIYINGGVVGPGLTTENAFQNSPTGPQSVFLMKLDPTGRQIIYCTYLDGTGGASTGDAGSGDVAVDSNNSAYIAGYAFSGDFPTLNSLQQFSGSGPDIFVTKFAPSGNQLVYSTFLGGSSVSGSASITLDASGNLYGTGYTISSDFPTKNAFQPTYGGGGDAILFEMSDSTVLPSSPLTVSPADLLFSYVLGTNTPASQIVTVAGGSFTATATAPWITLSPSGTNLTVSVIPGSLAVGTYQASISVAPPNGTPASVVISLNVLAPPPVLTSLDPAFVAVGSNDTTITINGSGFTSNSIVDVLGEPWTITPVMFINSSTLQFSIPGGNFSTPQSLPISVQNPQSPLSNVLVVSVGQPAPQFTAASVVNAASYAGGGVAPGEIVTVYGSNFGTQANAQVTFDYVPATIVYVTSTQLAVTVPYFVSGTTSLIVTSNSVASAPVTLNVVPSVPAVFTSDASGKGQAAALNQDYSINSASNPAPIGSVVQLFGTGGGTLTNDTLPHLTLPVSATVGGASAQVTYAGIAPGLVQGAMQVNVQIPSGITPGPSVPIVITVGQAMSNSVTVAVR